MVRDFSYTNHSRCHSLYSKLAIDWYFEQKPIVKFQKNSGKYFATIFIFWKCTTLQFNTLPNDLILCPIILISHIAQLFLIRSFIVSVKVGIFTLNMRDIIIYVARWWEKYLSKHSPLKHTCSWHDKLIVL